ncbi:MAG TPA: transglycosylase family protein [Propioniciclava sp.]|jgi:nucleoid-associated protein YgaU|uniref:transglycosylase family protein n=1 Tax=Propioniciclava sp. TaxID=2038686 RepID=UPI002C432EDC|nr:transglycosylase family protein [Propioniciclava sp.]HRL48397.1 transglycosylase family protein [Propioniciclava sp.]HRL79180.1 transglycosylase family protein [Propioniciclava sp.]
MNHTPKRLLAIMATSAVAVGGSVALAAPAHADVWDSVAQCESGGNWAISTGNGYSGGLQFSSSTWRAYGGTAYAPTAAQATKAQQIAVAKKVLAGQGAGAWPTCSKKAGLTKANGGSSDGTAEAAAQQATRSTASSSTKSTTTKSTTKKATTTKASTASTTSTTKAKASTKSAATSSSTTTSAKRATTVKSTATAGKRFITVKAGDTMSDLAAAHGVDGGWRSLWSLNQDQVSNPNLIFVGQQLAIG